VKTVPSPDLSYTDFIIYGNTRHDVLIVTNTPGKLFLVNLMGAWTLTVLCLNLYRIRSSTAVWQLVKFRSICTLRYSAGKDGSVKTNGAWITCFDYPVYSNETLSHVHWALHHDNGHADNMYTSALRYVLQRRMIQ